MLYLLHICIDNALVVTGLSTDKVQASTVHGQAVV